MKKLAIILAFVLCFSLLVGCKKKGGGEENPGFGEERPVQSNDAMFSDRDLDFTYRDETAIQVVLKGDTAEASDKSVQINGSVVTLTLEATYIISGNLDNGMLVVDMTKNEKPQLVFKGVDIHCDSSAPLYVKQADKVFVTLVEGTENSLSTGSSFEAIDKNKIDGAVFAKDDLTINGKGSLTVDCPAGHGIVCKNDLVLAGGSYDITAIGHALSGEDSVRVTQSKVTANIGKDAVHAKSDEAGDLGFVYIADGEFSLKAGGDGISATSSVQINAGSFAITTGGGVAAAPTTDLNALDAVSCKGIKADKNIIIKGGKATVDSCDDAINANGNVTISGGTYTLSTGDDAVTSDASVAVSGGTVKVLTCAEGFEAPEISISGGDVTLAVTKNALNAMGTGAGSHGRIDISGGSVSIYCDGDCLDTDGVIKLTGGNLVLTSSVNGGATALNWGTEGIINGGTLFAFGPSIVGKPFTSGEQGYLVVNTSKMEQGTAVTVKNSSGGTVASVTAPHGFSSIVISHADITSGQTYQVIVGSTTVNATAE